MKLYAKYMAVALCVFLMGSLAVPFCQAQARVFTRIFDLNSNGGYLGIEMKEVTKDNLSTYKLKSERGVIVSSVVKGSPAESANLQANDVILEFADMPVWSTQQFSRMVRETPEGRSVELGISRNGKPMDLTVTMGKREGMEPRAGIPSNLYQRIIPPGNEYFFDRRFPELPEGKPNPRMERRPRLGVSLIPLTDQLGDHLGVPGKKGALVSSVASGSPSEGKLEAGDVITHADGKSINDPEDLVRIVQDKREGTIILKVIRDKKEITIDVNLPAVENREGYKL